MEQFAGREAHENAERASSEEAAHVETTKARLEDLRKIYEDEESIKTEQVLERARKFAQKKTQRFWLAVITLISCVLSVSLLVWGYLLSTTVALLGSLVGCVCLILLVRTGKNIWQAWELRHIGPRGTQHPGRFSLSRRSIVLIVLVVFLIGGSIGLLSTGNNQLVVDIEQSITTAQANATYAAVTASAAQTEEATQNAAATATADAQNATITALPNMITPAQVAAAAVRNPDSSFGKLVLDDPLSDNNKGYGWDTSCAFADGTDTIGTSDISLCAATNTKFGDFVYQAQVKITEGGCGGIIFRYHPDSNSLNDFDQFIICQNQSYLLAIHHEAFLTSTYGENVSAIHGGLNQSNYVAVEAQGNTLKLYINQQFIATYNDNDPSPGQIGVVAESQTSGATIVTFNNADVWTR